ncbi:MAG: hypothetical protein RLZZ54_1225 [Cyanobacteriota bacterium]|jgi:hypothetical protein
MEIRDDCNQTVSRMEGNSLITLSCSGLSFVKIEAELPYGGRTHSNRDGGVVQLQSRRIGETVEIKSSGERHMAMKQVAVASGAHDLEPSDQKGLQPDDNLAECPSARLSSDRREKEICSRLEAITYSHRSRECRTRTKSLSCTDT